VPKKNPGMTL